MPAINDRLCCALEVSPTIAIDGAPGTGKHRAAGRVAALDSSRPVRELDLAAGVALDPGWFADAADTLTSGGRVILRHLEDLDADTVGQVRALARLTSESADRHGPGSGRLILVVNLTDAPQQVRDLVRQTATTVTLPELCTMKEHIPSVAQTLLSGMAGIHPGTTFSSAARQALMSYPWPGNARELRQAMVEVATTRPGWLIQLDQLPLWLRDAAQGRQLTGYERAEREAILAALQEAHGNRSKAAALLGIGRTTLYRKLQSLHIDCPEQMFTTSDAGNQPQG